MPHILSTLDLSEDTLEFLELLARFGADEITPHDKADLLRRLTKLAGEPARDQPDHTDVLRHLVEQLTTPDSSDNPQ